uniref:AlkB homolog 1, histone H2A dioxygenase n=1 Tax=Anas platyrhynchos platyrhynchos TaxID=8840 RepID=A0A493TNR5_ANAPP
MPSGGGCRKRSRLRARPAPSRPVPATHEGQLAPLHGPELREVLLQLLCGGKQRGYHTAPIPPRPPEIPSPHPSPWAGRGGAAGRTHCSTPSRAHRPRRCRSFAVPSAPPASRRPPPSCAAATAAAAAPGPPRLRAPPDRGAGPKMAAAAALGREGGEDAFRRLFRFYRRRDASELRGVLDFSAPGGQVFRSHLSISSVSDQDASRAGLQPVSRWKAYGLNGYPGFIFIRNPFLPGCQRHWVKQCLKLYTQKPNVCNLDLHMAPEKTIDLWGQSKEQLRQVLKTFHYEYELRWLEDIEE